MLCTPEWRTAAPQTPSFFFQHCSAACFVSQEGKDVLSSALEVVVARRSSRSVCVDTAGHGHSTAPTRAPKGLPSLLECIEAPLSILPFPSPPASRVFLSGTHIHARTHIYIQGCLAREAQLWCDTSSASLAARIPSPPPPTLAHPWTPLVLSALVAGGNGWLDQTNLYIDRYIAASPLFADALRVLKACLQGGSGTDFLFFPRPLSSLHDHSNSTTNRRPS